MIESHNLVDHSQQVPDFGDTDPQCVICKTVQSLPSDTQTTKDPSLQPMMTVDVADTTEPVNVSQTSDSSANKYPASLIPEKEHRNGVIKTEIPDSHRGIPKGGERIKQVCPHHSTRTVPKTTST
jgi:hypothetical protein